MNKQERRIIIDTANAITLEYWTCCNLYYLYLVKNKPNSDLLSISEDRYTQTKAIWESYQETFNKVKFSWFNTSFDKVKYNQVKSRLKEINEYVKLIESDTKRCLSNH